MPSHIQPDRGSLKCRKIRDASLINLLKYFKAQYFKATLLFMLLRYLKCKNIIFWWDSLHVLRIVYEFCD